MALFPFQKAHILIFSGCFSIYSLNITDVANNVSANCDKIRSYTADAHIYKFSFCVGMHEDDGRYVYRKPDSTSLRMIFSISNGDTTWSSGETYLDTGCQVDLKFTILNTPILSSAHAQNWVGKGFTIDSVGSTAAYLSYESTESGRIYRYEVDTTRWVVTRYYVSSNPYDYWGDPYTGCYAYTQVNGAWVLQSTAINCQAEFGNGGYAFSNIRVETDSTAAAAFLAGGSASFLPVVRTRGATVSIDGVSGPVVATVYSSLGRRVAGPLRTEEGVISFGRYLPAGRYCIAIRASGRRFVVPFTRTR